MSAAAKSLLIGTRTRTSSGSHGWRTAPTPFQIAEPLSFELVSTKTMPSGIIFSIYKVAGLFRTG